MLTSIVNAENGRNWIVLLEVDYIPEIHTAIFFLDYMLLHIT